MTTDFAVRRARPAGAPALAELRWRFKREDEGLREAPDSARMLHWTER
jgi:hypothetical protein